MATRPAAGKKQHWCAAQIQGHLLFCRHKHGHEIASEQTCAWLGLDFKVKLQRRTDEEGADRNKEENPKQHSGP